MTKARNIADLLDANGDVKSASLDNVPASDDASALTTGTLPVARLSDGSITSAKLNNDAKVVKSGSAPTSPVEGNLWYDTTNEILKVYNDTDSAFVKVVQVVPTLDSISGSIFNTLTGNLTLTGTGFLTANLIVSFTPSGGSASTVTVTPTNDTTSTVAIPTAIYGQAGATVIAIKVTNSDNKSSGNINKTVIALPTGGTITTYGSTRVHTFNSSANFVLASGFSISVDTLLVAGGGAGGNWHAGGGGAGGMFTYTHTPSAGTYSIVIGSGGAGGTTSVGSVGGNTTGFSQTAIGGGRGGNYEATAPTSGGSGAGGNGDSTYLTGGSGTAGQGNAGGTGVNGHQGGGGGGKGGNGGGGNGNTNAGNGGIGGTNNYQTGSNQYYAGGGGGGNWNSGIIAQGGNGGGGNGSYAQNSGPPTAGTVNTGGGGGGSGSQGQNTSYAAQTTGGSGILIIKYAI